MHIPGMLLFAVCSNLDSLVIGLSYGLRRVHITLRANLLMGLMILLGTAASMSCGKVLLALLPLRAEQVGGVIILLIGICALGGCFLRPEAQQEAPEARPGGVLTLGRALALGAGLSSNNIGLGVGASMAGFPLTATALLTVLLSLLFLGLGNRLGRRQAHCRAGRWAEPLSGGLMILLGLWELLAS